jgi:transcriptional regulator with XRE-family HTH domain
MNNEEQFNKEEFAVLLDRAKGNRSINNFANETGVSAAHISRFLRQMIASPPTPETISKFAAKAQNEVTYQDLMVAAGHITNKETFNNRDTFVDRESPRNLRMEREELARKFKQVILADLYESSFKWSVEKTEERVRFPDMKLNIDNEGYQRWYLTFMPVNPERSHYSIMNTIHLYGRIATFELKETDKFTIVVNDKKAYEMFFKRAPISLRANIYIMLIDLEWGKILKEEMLSKYRVE